MLLGSIAYGTVAVRQHADTIVDDKKILASDLDDEFDNLITHVNAIDASNVTDGTLTATKAAATSSMVMTDRKYGCEFELSSGSIIIRPPCEIVMDGVRSVLSATQTITLAGNLADSSPTPSAWYFIYATRNSASMLFQFSRKEPIVSTGRKLDNSVARYIGSVRTGDGVETIIGFYRAGDFYYFTEPNVASANLIATVTAVTTSFQVGVPNFFKSAILKYSAYVDTTFPAQCEFQFESNVAGSVRTPFQAIVEATNGHTGIVPFPLPLTIVAASRNLQGLRFRNIKNCAIGGDMRVVGWEDPLSLH